jgi:hypothetical protein
VAATRQDLYERDFYVWAREQARALKELAALRPNVDVDWSNLIDEVAYLAESERDACRGQLRRVVEHLLKLEFASAFEPRGVWVGEVGDARAILSDKLTATLRADLRRNLATVYRKACALTERKLMAYGEHEAVTTLPAECPYTLDQLLDDDFYPGLDRRPEGQALNVEPKMTNVPVLHHVPLPLHPHLPRLLRPLLPVQPDVVVVRDHLRRDEAALEVGVDHAGGLGTRGAPVGRPGARLLRADGEEGDQAQQVVALADHAVEAGLLQS